MKNVRLSKNAMFEPMIELMSTMVHGIVQRGGKTKVTPKSITRSTRARRINQGRLRTIWSIK
jgi:hypothetical protein